MANPRNIIAGVGAGGAGLSLAFFAPAGTSGPTGTSGTAGVQTVTITGTPTGGTFTLTWNGQTTAPIAFNATASAVQSAVNALPGAASVTATGGPLPTGVVLTFPALISQAALTASSAALTGGTTPAVVITQTTPGVQTTNEASATVPASFKDAGLCDSKGLTVKTNVSSNDVKAFGSLQVQRTLMTDQKKTVDVTFLETNPTSVAVYNALPLSAVTVDSSGYFKLSTGLPQTTQYAAVFDAFDGANHIRYYAPYCQNITPGDLTIGEGSPLVRPISLTLYPDSTGAVLYEYYLVDALKV
ncbi:MAG: hypothetical protein ACXVXP_02980 [Mycobacteriaceae bacterium]